MSGLSAARRLVVRQRSLAIRMICLSRGVYDRKVFCIGRNKTGTTSMQAIFQHYGYHQGLQREAETFVHKNRWEMQEDFWSWVERHEAFQDIPFSSSWFLPELYERFPNALYILTERDPDQWFASIANHHLHKLGLTLETDKAAIAAAFRKDDYVAEGFRYLNHCRQFKITSDDQLYDKAHYIANYKAHLELARTLIPKSQLLEIDITRATDTSELCAFLGIPSFLARPMVWANRRR